MWRKRVMWKLYLVYPVRGLCTLPFTLQVLLDSCPLTAFGGSICPWFPSSLMHSDFTVICTNITVWFLEIKWYLPQGHRYAVNVLIIAQQKEFTTGFGARKWSGKKCGLALFFCMILTFRVKIRLCQCQVALKLGWHYKFYGIYWT